MLRFLKQYYPIRNFLFVMGEFIMILLSVIFADWILTGKTIPKDGWLYVQVVIVSFVILMCLYYNDLYEFNVINRFSDMFVRIIQALGVATIILACFYFVFPILDVSSKVFILSALFIVLLISLWRFLYLQILERGMFNQKIILLGSGDLARNIFDEILARKDCGYTVCTVALESPDHEKFTKDTKVEASYRKDHAGLCEMAKDRGVHKVVVALKEQRGSFPTKELLKCRVDGIDVIQGNSFFEMLTGKLTVETINPAWLIFSYGFRKSGLVVFFKRLFDIIISLGMLICLSPILLLTAIIIKIDSRGPIFFSQERVGKRRKPYMMHKFRSMVDKAEEKSGPVWAQTNDNRVTNIGKFIRTTRIDEIPQLWNVLKGDMSMVGPRPEREFFVKGLEYIIPYYAERFAVKPGVTGWAQVSYPYGASVKDAMEKLNYDLFYQKNMSLTMDIFICLRTIKTVLFRKGAR